MRERTRFVGSMKLKSSLWRATALAVTRSLESSASAADNLLPVKNIEIDKKEHDVTTTGSGRSDKST